MTTPLFPIPVRAIVALAREQRRLRTQRREQPSDVELAGVHLHLDESWATPTLRGSIYEGWYEATERGIMEATLRSDDRYFEIGGGIGFMATCACRRVGADRVVVYEANPALTACVEATTRRNGFSPAVVNAVLGSADGEVDFFVHDDFWTSSLRPAPGAKRIRVPSQSFTRALADFRPTYLMVDIEGGEIELFDRHSLPDSVRAVCLETHPDVAGVDATQRLLVKLIGQGFALDLSRSCYSVAFFSRRG